MSSSVSKPFWSLGLEVEEYLKCSLLMLSLHVGIVFVASAVVLGLAANFANLFLPDIHRAYLSLRLILCVLIDDDRMCCAGDFARG